MAFLYTFEIWSPSGELLADVSRICTSRHFSARRNRSEVIELGLDLRGAERLARNLGMGFWGLFAVGMNELRVKRGNRYLMGGQLSYALPSVENGESLQLRATGFLDLFKDRYLQSPLRIENQDIGATMWSLINTTQSLTNGNFGVTQGDIQTSRTFSEDYEMFATSIKDILIAISERINSVDFAFTPDKQFNVYYPGIGSDKTELLFAYPGNIASLSLPRDATQLVNYSINRGSGMGDVQIVQTAQDPDSQVSFKRRERVDDYPAISVAQTLTDKGQESVRLYGSPMTIPDVVLDGSKDPALGAYWIGDQVRFAVTGREAFGPVDGQSWRIAEIDVRIDQNDHETIRLKVSIS